MKRLFKIEEPQFFAALRLAASALVVQVDEIFHHVLHRFRAGIDGINLQLRIHHAARREPVQRAVILQAFLRQKIRIGHLVVRRPRQPL